MYAGGDYINMGKSVEKNIGENQTSSKVSFVFLRLPSLSHSENFVGLFGPVKFPVHWLCRQS